MFTRVVAAIVLMAAFLAPTAVAQQWSAEQQEVWEAIEALFVALIAGDMDTAYLGVHEDFVFWNTGNSVPGDRTTARTLDSARWGPVGTKMYGATITPLTLLVYDDMATAHAYIRGYQAIGDGEPKWAAIRWTSVWKKEGNRWQQVLNYAHVE